MKKLLSLALCLALCLCLGVTAFASAEPAASGEPSGEASGSVAGTYTYTEVNAYSLEILWTLVLADDGTYALTEENMVAGVVTYTGTYTAYGDVIVCGPMAEAGPPVYDWSNPAGFNVTLTADGFVPGGEPASGEASGEAVALSDGGWPLSGSGDTSEAAYKSYLKAYMDCGPEMDGHEEELYGLIDQGVIDTAPVAMAFEDWFQENAMTYEEFVAANGVYELSLFGIISPANGSPT